MARQLVLLDPRPSEWRLDERTRRIGLRGVERARQALRVAIENDAADTHDDELQRQQPAA